MWSHAKDLLVPWCHLLNIAVCVCVCVCVCVRAWKLPLYYHHYTYWIPSTTQNHMTRTLLSHDLSHLFLWYVEFPASCNKGSNVHGPLWKRQWLGERRHELMLAAVFTHAVLSILRITEVYWEVLGYTENYWGMLKITEVYWEVLRYTENYWGILRSTEVYWDLLRYTEVYWELLRYTEVYWDLLRYTTCPSVVVWMVLMVPGWSLLTTWQTITPSMIQSPMSSESCTPIIDSMDWEDKVKTSHGEWSRHYYV